jgi:hypothetical protein
MKHASGSAHEISTALQRNPFAATVKIGASTDVKGLRHPVSDVLQAQQHRSLGASATFANPDAHLADSSGID